MSKYLQQTRSEFTGQYKYSVDCDKIKTDPTTLQVLDGSVRAKHTMIINAVVKENNGKIVVKIGKTNEIIKHEYDVSKKLETLDGFIKMHCMFSCHNNTNFSIINEPVNITTFKVCQSEQPSNVDVLIMPYIHNGQTLNDYLESNPEPTEYKNILKQIITNLYNAFVKTGFVHKELHFGNILIDEHNNPIIMDFDTSELNGIQGFFWADLQRLIGNVIEKSYPSNNKSYIVSGISGIQILLNTIMFIKSSNELFHKNVNELLSILEVSNVSVLHNTNKPVYNPNVFGGKKTIRKKTQKFPNKWALQNL